MRACVASAINFAIVVAAAASTDSRMPSQRTLLLFQSAFARTLQLVANFDNGILIQIIVAGLLGSTARTVMVQLHRISRSATLNAEEAVVGIGFAVAAAHRLEFLRAHFGASLEGER